MEKKELNKEELNLEFKCVSVGDADAFLSLEKSVAESKTYSGIFTEEEAKREVKENEVYLVYAGEELAGSVQFQRKTPEHVYISGLVVHPKFQGRGIGKRMAEFILSKIGVVERTDLVVHPKNDRSINIWKSLGFEVEKRIENYYGDGQPRIAMFRSGKENIS